MTNVTTFDGDFDFLNMFYNCKVTVGKLTYLNAYSAFVAAKCKNENDKRAFTRLNAIKAKKRNNTINKRDDWDDIKVDVMKNIQRAKFDQNPELKKKLMSIDGTIENRVMYTDTFWSKNMIHNKGKNMLGKILMELRDEYNQQEDEKV